MPLPARNPCRVSCYWIDDVKQRFMIPVTIFQRTFTRTMSQKLSFLFGIRAMVCQVHSSTMWPYQKAAWVRVTNLSWWVGYCVSYHIAVSRQSNICSSLVTYVPPALDLLRLQKTQSTSSSWGHRRELPVLHYPKIMVLYPSPFLVVITLLFSWITFINDCICILTRSLWSYILMIIYVILKNEGNKNSPYSLNVIVNYHYHSENRVITR